MIVVENRKEPKQQEPTKLLVYGDSKVGKSTAMSQLKNWVILDTGGNYDFLPGTIIEVSNLGDLRDVVSHFEESDDKFEGVVVDDFDSILSWVEDSICADNKVSHLGDIPMGGGFSQHRERTQKVVTAIENIFGKVILVSAARRITMGEKEVQYDSIAPDFAGKLKTAVYSTIDSIGYMYRNGKGELKISFDGMSNYEAGSRVPSLAGTDTIFNWNSIFSK